MAKNEDSVTKNKKNYYAFTAVGKIKESDIDKICFIVNDLGFKQMIFLKVYIDEDEEGIHFYYDAIEKRKYEKDKHRNK